MKLKKTKLLNVNEMNELDKQILETFIFEYGRCPIYDVNYGEFVLSRLSSGKLQWNMIPYRSINIPYSFSHNEISKTPAMLLNLGKRFVVDYQFDPNIVHESDGYTLFCADGTDKYFSAPRKIICPSLPPGICIALPEPEHCGRSVYKNIEYSPEDLNFGLFISSNIRILHLNPFPQIHYIDAE
jgi:hypothetical protein